MLFYSLFLALLLVAAVCDIRTKTIPPIIPLLLCASALLSPALLPYQRVLGALFSGAVLLIPTLIIPNAFGGGDIKLVTACGLVLGITSSIFALLIAFTLSIAPCIYYQISKKQTHIAFAPYLAAGFTLAAFYVI